MPNVPPDVVSDVETRLNSYQSTFLESDDVREWYRDFRTSGNHRMFSASERSVVHEEIQAHLKELDDLTNRFLEVAAMYWKKQVIVSPIQRMPPEILLEIFSHLTNPVKTTPITRPWSYEFGSPTRYLESLMRPQFSVFKRAGKHWEQPAASVCRQWRSLFKTGTFHSSIIIDAVGPSPIEPERVADWIRGSSGQNLLTGKIDANSPRHSQPGVYDQILKYLPRFEQLEWSGKLEFIAPMFTGRVDIPVARNLVALTLKWTRTAVLANSPEVTVASTEMPNLRFLRYNSYFNPMFLRLYAPKLAILELRTNRIDHSHFQALSRCFPALSLLYVSMRVINCDHKAIPSHHFSMPFPHLRAIHVRISESDTALSHRIPLLTGCKGLEIIGIDDRSPREGTLHLPPSDSWFLRYERHAPVRTSRLSTDVFKSLPKLRLCKLRDMPGFRWREHAARVQAENIELFEALAANQNLCPNLQLLELTSFAVKAETVYQLLDARSDSSNKEKSLRVTLKAGFVTFPRVEKADRDAFLRKMEILAPYDDYQKFYRHWVTFNRPPQVPPGPPANILPMAFAHIPQPQHGNVGDNIIVIEDDDSEDEDDLDVLPMFLQQLVELPEL
jgi:hypothetical protein